MDVESAAQWTRLVAGEIIQNCPSLSAVGFPSVKTAYLPGKGGALKYLTGEHYTLQTAAHGAALYL